MNWKETASQCKGLFSQMATLQFMRQLAFLCLIVHAFLKCVRRKWGKKGKQKKEPSSKSRVAWKITDRNPSVVTLRARLCSAELSTVCTWRSCCDLMKSCLSFFSHIRHTCNITCNMHITFTLLKPYHVIALLFFSWLSLFSLFFSSGCFYGPVCVCVCLCYCCSSSFHCLQFSWKPSRPLLFLEAHIRAAHRRRLQLTLYFDRFLRRKKIRK